ncbi:MAG: hypothetical protein Q7K26_04425 [bacterium]|nr:hypothetical protein [bacterium]
MKRLMPLLLIVILLPQVAFAAWWNPFSWFRAEEGQNDVQETKDDSKQPCSADDPIGLFTDCEAETTDDPNDPLGILNDDSQNKEEKVVEKIVTKTITVDNPELQKKINSLITENITLQTKINSQSSLVQQLNSCRADLIELKGATKINTADSVVEEKIKGRLLEIDEQILPKIDRYLLVASSDTITFNDGSTSISLILEINQLLDSYRVVDIKMAHKNLPTDIKTFKEGQWHVLDLKNYLVNSYIKYR